MKTMKKALLAMLAVVLLSSAMLISVFAAEEPFGDTAKADEYLSAIQNAAFEDKKALFDVYEEYMNTHRFPDTKLGQINLNLHLARAQQVKHEVTLQSIAALQSDETFKKIDIQGELTEKDWTRNIAYYNTVLVGYESRLYFDTEMEEYKAFAETLIPAVEAIEAKLAERIKTYYTAPLNEYGLKIVSNNGFEPDTNGNISKLNSTQFTTTGNYYEYVDNFGAGGSSHSYHEVLVSRTGDPYSYLNFGSDANNGVVFEFDFYYTGGELAMSCGTAGMGGGYHSELGYWSENGISSGYGGDGTVTKTKFEGSEGLIVKNAWNHVALSFSQATKEFTMYANYVKVGSYKWSLLTSSYSPQTCRFKLSGGEMYIDNILIYYGSAPRIVDQFTNMSDTEKLAYYVDAMLDESFDFANRELAYDWLCDNIGTYYDEVTGEYTDLIADDEAAKASVQAFLGFAFMPYKVKHHVELIHDETVSVPDKMELFRDLTDTITEMEYLDESKKIVFERDENPELYDALERYNKFDIAKLEDEFQLGNLAGLEEIYDRLMALDHDDFETIAARQSIHKEIDLYILAVGEENISTKDPATKINKDLAISLAKIEHDKVVRTISNYLEYFDKATNYQTRVRWIRRIEAEQFYNDVSIFDNPDREKHIPSMIDKYKAILNKMVGYTNEENSKKILQCVDILKEYAYELLNTDPENPILIEDVTGEMLLSYVVAEYEAYLEDDTLSITAWEYARKYVLIARAAMEEGYVPTYSGLSVALRFYNPLFAYYYDLVQLDHIEQIERALSRYETAQTFIDKKGIFIYVETYLAENDIDFTREDIQAIQLRVDAIRAQIEEQEGEGEMLPSAAEQEYIAFLEENAVKFVAAVAQMRAAKDYVTLEAAYKNAQQYYYFIAINDAHTQDAVEEYMTLESKMLEWKEYSDLFIGIINSLSSSDTLDSTYEKLVRAYSVKDLAEATYPGMKEALATYEQAYKNYTDAVNAVNTEVVETVEVMTANVTPYTVIQTIINFFKKLFG